MLTLCNVEEDEFCFSEKKEEVKSEKKEEGFLLEFFADVINSPEVKAVAGITAGFAVMAVKVFYGQDIVDEHDHYVHDHTHNDGHVCSMLGCCGGEICGSCS